MANDVARALIRESKRHLLEESWPRLEKAVPLLTEEELWRRANSSTNSVGNLLLHLNGNVRQWIVSGLGGRADERVRALEFSEKGPIQARELMERLEGTLREAASVLDALDPDRLLETRLIQGSEVSVLQALIHVVEHFSYHVGQITHMVKSIEDVDLGLYSGQDLNAGNEPV